MICLLKLLELKQVRPVHVDDISIKKVLGKEFVSFQCQESSVNNFLDPSSLENSSQATRRTRSFKINFSSVKLGNPQRYVETADGEMMNDSWEDGIKPDPKREKVKGWGCWLTRVKFIGLQNPRRARVLEKSEGGRRGGCYSRRTFENLVLYTLPTTTLSHHRYEHTKPFFYFSANLYPSQGGESRNLKPGRSVDWFCFPTLYNTSLTKEGTESVICLKRGRARGDFR